MYLLMKIIKRKQSGSNSKKNDKTTLRIETPKCLNNNYVETNASDSEIQEIAKQHNRFRPSKLYKFRTPIEPIGIKNFDLYDAVILNEDSTGEDYHMVTGGTKPLHDQKSNNTTFSQSARLIAESKNPSQDPGHQIAFAIETFATGNSQPSITSKKVNQYHALLRSLALKTFQKIQ